MKVSGPHVAPSQSDARHLPALRLEDGMGQLQPETNHEDAAESIPLRPRPRFGLGRFDNAASSAAGRKLNWSNLVSADSVNMSRHTLRRNIKDRSMLNCSR
jgi:hypothetical protein